MTKKTHLAAGVLATAGAISLCGVHPNPYIFGIVGSIVPDWDRYLGMKHRGVSHSFVFAVGLGIMISMINMSFGIAFMFNYCLHIALDSFTLMGVPAGKPFFNDYYGAKLIKSCGAEDMFLLLVLLLLISKLLIRI